MTKKAYQKPVVQVVVLRQRAQLLADSIESVLSNGLDSSEELLLGSETEDPWNLAW